MAFTIVIFATMLFTQVFCATEVSTNSISSTNAPGNLSYQDLVYILQARNGVVQRPRPISRCARAILGCCKSNEMNETCSESFGCGAFFFDDNPCDDKFIIDALNAAKAFYNQVKDIEDTGKAN